MATTRRPRRGQVVLRCPPGDLDLNAAGELARKAPRSTARYEALAIQCYGQTPESDVSDEFLTSVVRLATDLGLPVLRVFNLPAHAVGRLEGLAGDAVTTEYGLADLTTMNALVGPRATADEYVTAATRPTATSRGAEGEGS